MYIVMLIINKVKFKKYILYEKIFLTIKNILKINLLSHIILFFLLNHIILFVIFIETNQITTNITKLYIKLQLFTLVSFYVIFCSKI